MDSLVAVFVARKRVREEEISAPMMAFRMKGAGMKIWIGSRGSPKDSYALPSGRLRG